MFLVAIFFGIICAPICAAIAKSKNRDAGMWGLMGFLFSFFAVIAIALMGKREPQSVVISGAAPSTTPAQPVAPSLSLAEEIGRWKELLDSGAISDEEFAAKKTELLARK